MAAMTISLYENLAIADRFIAEITPHFERWKHSTRDIGGNWTGEGEYAGSREQMDDFFLTNIGRRILVGHGGVTWWEGQIVRMEYTRNGQQFVRSMEDLANRVKVIYSKVGDNLFTNGDVESGAWTAVGAPSTHETTTDWWARGTTAMHVVTNLNGDGTEVQNSIGVTAYTAYNCSVIMNVVSGTWTLRVWDQAMTETIAERATPGTGRVVLQCQVPDSNAYETVRVRITADAPYEMYADGAVLRSAPVRSETKWYPDTDSIDEYGRKEYVVLEREMTDDEADAAAQKELAESAWPRTTAPRKGATAVPSRSERPDKLIVTCMGMVWTLGWRYGLTEGTDQADNHVTALIDESEFISSSNAVIKSNSAEVFLETVNPTTLWDQIEKIIEVGDGSGAVWQAGVYPGREFRYEARPSGTQYQFSKGQLENFGGGNVQPLEFYPHWCQMTDMPLEPTPAGASDADDPRRVWLEEASFVYERRRGVEEIRLEWEAAE